LTTPASQTPIGFEGTLFTPDQTGYATVTARLGTQRVGPITGEPVDATEPGPISLAVVGRDGEYADLVFTDLDSAIAVRNALTIAIRVADTRDRTRDQPRSDTRGPSIDEEPPHAAAVPGDDMPVLSLDGETFTLAELRAEDR
jgi:hypothetical protein